MEASHMTALALLLLAALRGANGNTGTFFIISSGGKTSLFAEMF